MNTRSFVIGLAVLFVALPPPAYALDPPDELAIRAFAKPAGQRLHLLLRVPFKALNGINFPSRGTQGELDLAGVEAVLPSAARWWIADNLDLYPPTTLPPTPHLAAPRRPPP